MRLGSHSRLILLTRQANYIIFGIWQQTIYLHVLIAKENQLRLETIKKYVKSVKEKTILENVKNAGIILILRKDMTKKGTRTIIGEGGSPQSTIKNSLLGNMEKSVSVVARKQSLYTTKMEIDTIQILRISKFSVNVATKYMCITAQPIYRISSRRYSQYHWKQWTNTINYGEGDKALGEKLGVTMEEAKALKEEYFKPYPDVKSLDRKSVV